jgi:hypothetical protein
LDRPAVGLALILSLTTPSAGQPTGFDTIPGLAVKEISAPDTDTDIVAARSVGTAIGTPVTRASARQRARCGLGASRKGRLHLVERYGRRFLRPGRHSGAVGVSRPGALKRS